jgi:lysophospholipase L1-like esterase
MMHIQPNSRLLFIGDSITDCGRRRPIGEGGFGLELGNGFVNLVGVALAAAYPDYGIKIINMGIAGNTARDLKARWKTDVLDLRPDWLVIKIGINDVFQSYGFGWGRVRSTALKEYEDILEGVVQQVRPQLQGLVMMTPYIVEPDRREPLRTAMDEYGAVVGQIAARHRAVLVDTQAAFDRVNEWMRPMELAADQIHVNMIGHMVLARAFLHSIGYSWGRMLVQG